MKKYIIELPLTFTVEIDDVNDTDEKRQAAVIERTRQYLASLSARRIRNTDDFWYRPAE